MFNKSKKSITAFLLTLAMVLSISNLSLVNVMAADEPKDGDTYTFQVLFTSDLHGSFSDWNYATNKASTGLAKLSTLIKSHTANGSFSTKSAASSLIDTANVPVVSKGGYAGKDSASTRNDTILIDLGDTIQGNGTGNFITGLDGKNPFPVIKGMEYLGYDAEILGNHEFNFGIDKLEQAYAGFSGALLGGNIFKADGTAAFAPYYIKTMPNGLKVAVIGMTTPNIDRWDSTNLEAKGYTTKGADVVTAETIKHLKDNKLADIFIAAEHLSPGDEYDSVGSGSKSVLEYGDNAKELSVFLGAHGHLETTTSYNGVKYVENRNAGATLGQVFITATYNGSAKKWEVKDKTADVQTRLLADKSFKAGSSAGKDLNLKNAEEDLVADADYMIAIAAEDKAGKDYSASVVGTLVGGPLVPAATIPGTYEGYLQDTPLIDLINNVMMYYTGAEIAGTAPLDTNANAQPGKLTRGGVTTIYKYDNNTLYKLKMTGEQLKKWMEWSYSFFGEYNEKGVKNMGPAFDPATDITIPYGNGGMAGYNQDSFSGLKYDVDLSKPVGSRIVNMKNMDDTPFNMEKEYIVAANNYRSTTQLLVTSSTGVFKPGEKTAELLQADVASDIASDGMLGLIIDYISKQPNATISNTCDNNWKILNVNFDPIQRAVLAQAIKDGKIDLANPVNASYDKRAVKISEVTALIDSGAYKTGVSIEGADSVSLQKAIADGKYKTVGFIGFNDFHGTLDDSASSSNPGSPKLATAIKEEVAKNPNSTIVLSAGDSYQGSAVSNLNYGKPVSEVLKAINTKYAAVGNHEFDWSTSHFAEWEKDGNLKFLAANIYDKKTDKIASFVKPYAIENVNGIKVGIIGLATPETVTLAKAEFVNNYEFREPNAIAAQLEKDLRAQGCKIVIVLAHLPTSQDAKGEITGAGADLANAVPTLDAIITGHSHKLVSGKVNGVPVVQGDYNGRAIDQLMFVFDANGNRVTTLYGVKNLKSPVKDTLKNDAEVSKIVDTYVTNLKPMLEEVVGKHDGQNLTEKPQVENWANKVLYDYLKRTQPSPYIVIQNAGGWRSGAVPLNAGDITMNYMYTLMPFDNEVVLMEMKGSDLKAILDKPDSEYGSACGVYGMTRTAPYIELATGKELDPNATYKVMTNDFMLTGGDKFDFSKKLSSSFLGVPLRNAMVEELMFEAGITASLKPAASGGSGIYVVEDGDNLTSIAKKYNTTWREIQKVNNLKDPNLIYPGQELILPAA